ncbi:MAG: helix-turn-helix transcriptional regulator [Rhodocyclaceae bacterium]|nr:helix-turn-helix transcriptional regulator [Rhodocyclaceae bacterium]
MNLGATIRQLRKRKDWTQDELAHQAGTTAANISRIEAEKHRPSAELLSSIAYVLGVKVYEMVAMAEGLTQTALTQEFDPDEEVVVGYFRKMPKEERELFKAIGASFCKVRRAKPQFVPMEVGN